MSADLIIARARNLLGTRFRLHGRSAATGLDCVGLVGLAYDQVEGLPTGYHLRSDVKSNWFQMLDKFLDRKTDLTMAPADLVMMQAGPMQIHLGLWSGGGLIHADTRLRRVVEMPGTPDWPILGLWHRRTKGQI